jgi:peroxiredoxin (alkyl hydroperoxide reductase subunit C)
MYFLRATYLVDETGKIFHESVNDMPLAVTCKRILRMVDAYTHNGEKEKFVLQTGKLEKKQ